MKYIITESRIMDAIYEYLDSEFKEKDLFWQWEDGSEGQIANFILDRTQPMDHVVTFFDYIKPEYYIDLLKNPAYNTMMYEKFAKNWLKDAPALTFKDTKFVKHMDEVFGGRWRQVFEKWFEDNYGDEFPVKTYIYYK